MCKILKVKRSSYYAWQTKLLSRHAKEDQKLSAYIKSIFVENRQIYGTRRIQKALSNQGIQTSRRRIGRLMKNQNLHCKTKRKFKPTTDSKHTLPIADNLLDRKFQVGDPDRVYVGDITYVWTSEGWLYLAVVIDLFSRRIVGWSLKERMQAALVNEAFLQAIWKRKPIKGMIYHTDRGSQYASKSHRKILQTYGIKQSMSRKGNCWDNAVSESFFHTIKTELIHHKKFSTRADAKKAIFEYIEVFYNRKRLHSANGYMPPELFEQTRVL